ncbi:lipase [Gymnopilus junonius]|uniref:Lipase n=1 Tax=Gymnopilus junonius TaxID=109634 RepID=A0A9P5TSD9_GYMJU|nr:lipase [Gymnopilus junonius]
MARFSFLRASVATLFATAGLFGLPGQAAPLRRTASITALSTADITSFRPFSFYAAMAYCQPSQILAKSCGQNCDANPTFEPVASGGDGIDVQFWYVGIDPTLQSVVVGHQGTDPSKIVPLLTDGDFFLTKLNSTLFPSVSSSIEVHSGFADEHAKTATSVLASVQTALQKSGLKKVTLVGHSLGAALSLIESVYLPQFLPGVTFKMIGYGLPRVGNQAFASYIDANVDLDHVNNKEDFVPTLPGIFLGFHHPQGEKHIQDDNSWLDCPGDDNSDKKCTTGDVSNVFEGQLSDHDGPYDIVTMGSSTCASS